MNPIRTLSAALLTTTTIGLPALTLQGCSDPTAVPRTRHVVVERLDGEAFGRSTADAHRAVALIGNEARAVVVAPRQDQVAQALGVPWDGRPVRVPIALPTAVRDLGATDFSLTVQKLPFSSALDEEILQNIADGVFTRKVDRGWTLTRQTDDPDRAIVEYTPEDMKEGEQAQFNLRLFSIAESPLELDSRPFGSGADRLLELAWGVTRPSATADPGAARFRAGLRCGEASELLLVDEEIPFDSADSWRDVSLPLPPSKDGCRLRLHASGRDGRPTRGAVWAVPRILGPQTDAAPQPNIVLISLDTLRADHMSGYGYARPTTPQIDRRLMREGTTFEDVTTTFPQTDVSHLSLFTGMWGAATPERGRLSRTTAIQTLPEALRAGGYETAAFTEDALVAGSFGFWFGFDRFYERSYDHDDRGTLTFADGIEHLRTNRDRRFFLFLHTYKTHDPYVPSPAYESYFTDADQWQKSPPDARVPPRHRGICDDYDRTIREADDLVASFLDELEELGLADDTLIVVLSDHGEAFGEHGAVGHGFAAHQEEVGIPLILRGPGIPVDKRIPTPVSIVDVAPTLLDLLGLPPLSRAHGISLVPGLRGRALPEDRPLYFNWLKTGSIGLRRGRWKFLQAAGHHELFDLRADPAEKNPLRRGEPARPEDIARVDAHRVETERLRKELAPREPGTSRPVSSEMERSLRALGYVD